MKRKLLVLGMVLALVALLMAACAPAAAPAPERVAINFMSADPGGSWYPSAIALAAIWETNVPGLSFTHIPGGGVANAKGVGTGEAEIGITTSISAGDAVLGNPPFEKKITTLRAMAVFLAEIYNIVVFADSDIHSLADLKGKRICAAKKGWTAETLTKRQLEAVGLTYDDMAKVEFVTPSEGVKLMRDGHLDASIIGFDVVGDPQLAELTVFKAIRILPVPDDVMAKLQANNPGISKVVILKGSYKGVDADVPGITGATGLIVNPDVSEDLVYKMTRAMAEKWVSHMQPVMESFKGIQPQDLSRPILGVDFHPGAARYYKEVGW